MENQENLYPWALKSHAVFVLNLRRLRLTEMVLLRTRSTAHKAGAHLTWTLGLWLSLGRLL